MNIVITILSIVAGIVALLLIVAFFMKKGYNTHQEIIIHEPLQKVFDYLMQIRNQDNFNKWIMVDPDMKREYKGTDGTVGFIYAWNGNKEAGEGEQEIKTIDKGKKIEMELRFVRPFSGVAHAKMTTESLSASQTKVIWNTNSNMKYPINLMLPLIVKMLEKDMGTSLTTLKKILEK
ncbi:MAG: SRPBCC family protein [Ferruginibacter sp.]